MQDYSHIPEVMKNFYVNIFFNIFGKNIISAILRDAENGIAEIKHWNTPSIFGGISAIGKINPAMWKLDFCLPLKNTEWILK